jgi:very-short-patch-repair endonuclease
MNNTEKVIALYKYIRELCALKYKIVTDINKQPWTCFLKDITADSENISMFYRDRVDEESSDDTVLLTVQKPDFQRCPKPPEILLDWLEPGWDLYSSNVKVKDIRSNTPNAEIGQKETEHFGDSNQRKIALTKWEAARDIWVKKQLGIARVRQFFSQLFKVYTDLEREPETLELMVGNGILLETRNKNINHPVLLKRVKLQFNAKINEISIHDTDTEPELYTLLLQDIRDINHNSVKQLIEELRDNYYHPLDRNDSPDFLRAMTHILCPESKFITNENEKVSTEDKIITTFDPVFFERKRIDGTLKTIEAIIHNIEDCGYIPNHLIDLVDGGMVEIPQLDYEQTIEEQLAALNGESLPILLSKAANREQLEIAERIEQYNAVLVQGPPGTGKTHTIANLLGHFLAQGKSVLVTSHTKKALTVLKEKVPDEIKDLCVSVLDDTNLDMVRSVDGVSEYMSRHTANELRKQVESSIRQRANIIYKLAEIRKLIYSIKYKEYEPIVYNGDSYSPSEAAAFVYSNAEELSYIPGKVKLYHPLPVTYEQLIQLYRSNEGISESEERELSYGIPMPDSLLKPITIKEDVQQAVECRRAIETISSRLGIQIKMDFNENAIFTGVSAVPLVRKPTVYRLDHLSKFIDTFKNLGQWMINAAVDGKKGGGYRSRWETLIESIINTVKIADLLVAQTVGRIVSINSEITTEQALQQITKIEEIIRRKGKVSKLDLLFNKQLEYVYNSVSVNGSSVKTTDDCILIQTYLELLENRRRTSIIWDELMAKQGLPRFFDLGEEPEHISSKMISNIKRYLDWYNNDYKQLLLLVEQAGFNANLIFPESELDSDIIRTEKTIKVVQKQLPLYIDLANCFLIVIEIELRKYQAIHTLTIGERSSSSACKSAMDALVRGNVVEYERYYHRLSELYEKYSLKSVREKTLTDIEPIAPEWANAIKNRIGIHGEASVPQTINDAWKWKQFAGIIDLITSEPFEQLQQKAVILSKELHQITAKVASNKAWYHLLYRTERNLDMKQALNGWKLTVKKIGKGTGKNAPILKKQAREKMSKCQQAVPAWIMPINRAMDSLDPQNNTFDVIIIDEASQSDVSALGILYMAKKIIIVGDNEQVSPMAIGTDIDKMNALRNMYIKDTIPNWDLYDAKTSLYDIVGTTFQPLMLREHFRCLPDIIGYSNKLSYDYKIKPLREDGSSNVYPSVVQFRVDNGVRDGIKKTNVAEAENIVALMMACMEQEEYDGMTFGAISLLGDDQAVRIQQIIFERLEPAVIELRRILCGNASHFQGDERDIIFLSLVDSNEGDGPLRMTGEGPDQSTKQRYNVAASRAKDQLWVVHSLDFTRDLQSGDLRRDLLEYASNPKAYSQMVDKVSKESESPFETAVAKALFAAGYHIVQQWQVGIYRIDIVVQYKGRSVAVECDGVKFHSGEEKIRDDMERQGILERIGWRFIRIRGSEYYRDPNRTIEQVKQDLTDFGIYPETMIETSIEQNSYELLERIKTRAAQILDGWHDDSDIDLFKLGNPSKVEQPKEVQLSIVEGNPSAISSNITVPINNSCLPLKDVNLDQKEVIKLADNPILVVTQGSKSTKEQNKRQLEAKQWPNGSVLISKLKSAGVYYIDNRFQSGIIWVPIDGDMKQVEELIHVSGLRYNYERRGSVATENKPALRIMID